MHAVLIYLRVSAAAVFEVVMTCTDSSLSERPAEWKLSSVVQLKVRPVKKLQTHFKRIEMLCSIFLNAPRREPIFSLQFRLFIPTARRGEQKREGERDAESVRERQRE